MFRSVSTWQRVRICAISGVVMVGVLTPSTQGQALRPETPTPNFDAYHNARPHYAERRAVGSYQNLTQRTALRGFQALNRRTNQRGGLSPFSLQRNHLAALRSGAGSRSAMLLGGIPFSSSRAGAFSRFGRSGRKSAATPQGTVGAAVARRHLLLAGASRNEPIYRALQRMGGRGGAVQRAVAATPFPPPDGESAEAIGPEILLSQFLKTRADIDQEDMRNRAWEYFRDGEYTNAARTFDTATSLDRSDHTARLGELFCHVILQADRTALAVFGELLRHDRELFGRSLGGTGTQDPASLFGDPKRAVKLVTDARVNSDRSQSTADERAIYLLVLWHLGETNAAQLGADTLAREYPKSAFTGWPAEMRRVLARGRLGS